MNLHSRFIMLSFAGYVAVAMTLASPLNAQNLTLEGQTGGFLTPTAYVVYTDKGHTFSHPAISYHFVDTAKVIGNIQTVSFLEGFANRAELGYTRSIHTLGNSVTTPGSFSELWNYSGMNVFNGKVVAIKDGEFGPWTPGLAGGFVVRTGDNFVSSAVNKLYLGGNGNAYTNEDVYVAVTKTWAHPPLPFLANLGIKATNASIFGIGGQSTRFGGRLFGGLGIPLPFLFKTVIVPSAGFTQEPPTSKNLGAILVAGKADLPTTLDYAVRVTQKDHPHFAFDIGVGHVAGNIGAVPIIVKGVPVGTLPVDLEAQHVVGIGISIRP